MADETDVVTKKRRPLIPYQIKLEPRLQQVSKRDSLLLSIGAVVVALLLGAIVLRIVGGNPIQAYAHIAGASFGSVGVFSDTLVKAIPLILVGVACALAFQMKLWNIGAEGQFYMGAFGASLIVLLPVLPETAPKWLFVIVMAFSGILFGSLWGFIPGYLKAKFNVNEIISTLMLNYIAIAWNNYFIFSVWSEGGFQMSPMFPRNAWLPRLSDFAEQAPFFRGLTTHFGLVLAVIVAVIAWFILFRSQWGYEIRLIGDNPKAAQYAGIKIARNTILVMMLSGAIAGLAGMSEISGVVHRLQGSISPGYGFTGIIVAWLAKLNPLLIVPVSILFGALLLAGREIQPSGIPKMIQGIILVCLITSDFFLRYRVYMVRRGEE
ncbi:MAG: ABC transporter permease [Anaerolineaceae bacterium]|nr:ABC transporter permease [Anaerolineaceae bacterium]